MEDKTTGEIVLFSILILTFLMTIGNTNYFEPNMHAVPQSNLFIASTRMQCSLTTVASNILNVVTFSN
jgi:hypothetical protein